MAENTYNEFGPKVSQGLDDLMEGIRDAVNVGLSDGQISQALNIATSDIAQQVAELRRKQAEVQEDDQFFNARKRLIDLLGDFSNPVDSDTLYDAVDAIVYEEGDEDSFYEQREREPVNLVLEIATQHDVATVSAYVQRDVLPSVVAAYGPYEVGTVFPSHNGVYEIALRATGPSFNTYNGDMTGYLSGREDTIGGYSLATRIRRADATTVDEAVARANNRVMGDDDGVVADAPGTLVISFTRVGGGVLSDEELDTPIETARKELAKHLGPVRAVLVEPVEEGCSVRRVVYALDGEGDLDARALSVGAVTFRGELEFAGLGRVRAERV